MASTTTPTTTSNKEIVKEFTDLIRVYKDGTVERLFGSPIVPPSINDPQTGVSSKDIVISENPSISARLYLPKLSENHPQSQKLPILVYFHGGAFCLESAFSYLDHCYLNLLVSQANVIAVSVEYRLAPENPLPAGYEDCWDCLKWVANHSAKCLSDNAEPWLINHGDFNKIYLGGESAGGNIVHNVALRSGIEGLPGDVKILGAYLSCPYFWSSKPIGSEAIEGHEQSLPVRVWEFVYPSAPGGIDNAMINPLVSGAPSLAGLGCSKMLVFVAGKDQLRDRGVWYYKAVKNNGWQGEVELFEVEDEDHCFHAFDTETEKAKNVIKRFASFLI